MATLSVLVAMMAHIFLVAAATLVITNYVKHAPEVAAHASPVSLGKR